MIPHAYSVRDRPDGYSKRLYFYGDHILRGLPMQIENFDCPMGFIRSDKAGAFLAFLTTVSEFCGTVSILELALYVEQRTGCKAILSDSRAFAPYNGEPAYSICTDLAKIAGIHFHTAARLDPAAG